MHIHVGLPEFITTACYIIIFAFFWRWLATRMHDNKVGQAMAFIF